MNIQSLSSAVIIGGSIISDNDLNKTILEGSQIWLTGDVLEINVTVSPASGNHNLRVITTNGIEDTFSFRTP